jgi:hypothetical protein
MPYVAAAAALSFAASAMAQTPPSSKPAGPPESSAAPSGAPKSAAPDPDPKSASSSGENASASAAGGVMSGMSVKDNTGALIGEVKSVKDGVATIQMGSDTFTVDSNKLGVANGAATINATQAELKKMLPPKK